MTTTLQRSAIWLALGLAFILVILSLSLITPEIVNAQGGDDPAATEEVGDDTDTTDDAEMEADEDMEDMADAETVSAEPSADMPDPFANVSGDNSYCLVCHANSDDSITLEDGTVIDLQYAANIENDFAHAIHEQAELGCVDCHGEDSFPHVDPVPPSEMAYILQYEGECLTCHGVDHPDGTGQQIAFAGVLGDSELLQGTECVECHLAGDEWASVHPNTANAIDVDPQDCESCHVSTVHEWEMSAHGSQQLACSTCHLDGQGTLRFEDTQTLCLNCHADSQRTFTHITHQDQVCTDCHWDVTDANYTHHVLLNGQAQPSGHDLMVETDTCVDCHAQDDTIQLVAQADPNNIEARSESVRALATAREVEDLEAELEETRDEEANTATLRLFQGAIVGLVLGLILVFVARRWRIYRQVNE
jgi:hypothetical protein